MQIELKDDKIKMHRIVNFIYIGGQMKKDKISNFQKDVFNELINKYEFLIDELEFGTKRIFIASKNIDMDSLYIVAISSDNKVHEVNRLIKSHFDNQGLKITLNTIVLLKNSNNEELELPINSIVIDTEKRMLVKYEQVSKPIVLILEDILKRPLRRRKTIREVLKDFNKNTPIATKCIIGINVWIFIITVIISFFINGEVFMNLLDVDSRILYIMGAKVNYLILENREWWRSVTHMFLHGGIIHLLFNMYALYLIGPSVEKILGSVKFIITYLFLGIGACIFSMQFTNGFSVGASGAIFGLLGIVFVIAYLNKNNGHKSREVFKNILMIILLNLFIGFSSTGIDNAAHIGGLIVGIGIGYFAISKKLTSMI